MKVRIPTPLRSYTAQAAVVEARGATVGEVFDDLDAQFPGLRFRVVDEQDRIRRHMKVWVNDEAVRDLGTAVRPSDEVTIMQALSGGCGDVTSGPDPARPQRVPSPACRPGPCSRRRSAS